MELNSVAIGQAFANFTHYDLHSDNILLTPCSKDIVYVYAFQKDLAFAVPTLGYTAKIIDCGFSFVDTLKGNYLNSSMGHTDVGFVSDRFDWVSDPKLFLITIKYELEKYRKGTKHFSNIVKNLFSCLTVEWDSGWDDFGGRSAADALLNDLEKKCKFESKVFDKYSPFALDLLCNLIILPLEKKKFDNIYISYKAFVHEFMKIEDNIGSTQYNLWILKCIVDSARKHKESYLQNNEDGLTQFRRDIHQAIMKVSKFCSPRQIHYEKMLVSLYNFASCAEGYFYNFMEKKMKKKYDEYKDIPVHGILDIIRILSCNLEDKYVYNENTKVIVIDIGNETQHPMETLNLETISTLNELAPELRGDYFYSLYVKQNNIVDDEIKIDDMNEDMNNENEDMNEDTNHENEDVESQENDDKENDESSKDEDYSDVDDDILDLNEDEDEDEDEDDDSDEEDEFFVDVHENRGLEHISEGDEDN